MHPEQILLKKLEANNVRINQQGNSGPIINFSAVSSTQGNIMDFVMKSERGNKHKDEKNLVSAQCS